MPKRGEAASPKQRAALQAGAAKKKAMQKKAREEGRPKASDRWAMLLDGTLTVADLDDEELERMKVRGADGGFAGQRKGMPSHIAQQMRAESIKRANDMFRVAAPAAVKRLLEIASDPDTKDSDAVRALQMVLERSLGKVPDTVRVEAADAWGKLMRDATPEQFAREAIEDD